jgi:hypothetical protein
MGGSEWVAATASFTVFVISQGRSGARFSGVLGKRCRFGFSMARFLATLIGPPKMSQTCGSKLWEADLYRGVYHRDEMMTSKSRCLSI